LAQIPGPYVIRNGVAYLTRTTDGYGKHTEVGTSTVAATLIADPAAHEYLWL
jgi:hypothetical protein